MRRKHRIKGIEPYWVEVTFEMDMDKFGNLVYSVRREKVKDLIERKLPRNIEADIEYRCSCGKEFKTFQEAKEHIREVRT